jgi:hypothetical protein
MDFTSCKYYLGWALGIACIATTALGYLGYAITNMRNAILRTSELWRQGFMEIVKANVD